MTVTSRYSQTPLPGHLRHRMACAWEYVQGNADHAPVRVLPDGHIDLIWDGHTVFVAGPDTTAAMAHVPAGTTLTAVRLAPGFGSPFLGMPLHAIQNQRVALQDVWGARAGRLVDALLDAQDPQSVLVEYGACASGAPDSGMRQVFSLMRQGRTRVGDLASQIGMSERSLRRHCLEAFGYGPKTLDRILRLQRFLSLASDSPDMTTAALDAGYFDAPHLARDAHQLAGLTTSELLAQHGQ
ncbi:MULTISPECIES: helix-turn-helix domain-containing protein [Dyella]|uniref:Helix-turn-helix domain-containing protein n=2 Tax=Dyella TaxID=231454 RepID=A0A4R0YRP7_9GAMM|nr:MULTISPECIES: helix-turn-helix domain-containing protein [Dyella]TBR40424.1 helix-turn-helix domain-containing protein [Dyella terrae]TCI11993.1 helix-turn-helix domain-containing protein [Dyella soli]